MDFKSFPSRSKISISLLAVTTEYQRCVCVKAVGVVPSGSVIFLGKAKEVGLS